MNLFSNEPVFRYFEQISQIPRGSGNEKKISDFLTNFAKSKNLEVYQDRALNVIIKKPGTFGYENAPTVIIQGHMDMVCDKNKSTKHDFEKDPIKLKVDGDFLYAEDTTLGADNGIAVAIAMELLASDNIPHPPLEVIITTGEETGLEGAMALDMTDLKGKFLINLDSEEEGKILVGCAGGVTTRYILPAAWEGIPQGYKAYRVKIRGLKGGHSGADIDKGRGNSNKLLGRVLTGLSRKIDYYLAEVSGGLKNNAIPREADAVILIRESDEGLLSKEIGEYDSIFKNELRATDPGVAVTYEREEVSVNKVLSKETGKKAIELLLLIINGIQTMSGEIEGLVVSSSNLGVVTTSEERIEFESAVRSSVRSLKESILEQSKVIADLVNAKFITSADYPEWEYNPNSKLRNICEKVYERMYGSKPETVAIHAGLECGLFKEKMPDLDMVSIGPNLYDVHTPNEHLSISSTKRVWEYILEILKEIK